MADHNRWVLRAGGLAAAVLPAVLYGLTETPSLGFADAGEFALVTHIAGIAHPPGFPAYVLAGWLWGKALSVLSPVHLLNMVWFSITCVATASLLLFFTMVHLLDRARPGQSLLSAVASLVAVLAFATGVTVWHWANSIEVYGFHILAMALLVHGLTAYRRNGKPVYLVTAAAGLAAGLANHHLTMVFFLPFVPLFFTTGFLWNEPVRQPPLRYVGVLRSKPFLLFTACAALLTACCYAWLYVRAGQDMPFKFGSPDTPSRLFYHISGGAWQKNTARSVEGLAALRFPYFVRLVWEQVFLFIPFALWGLAVWWRSGRRYLVVAVTVYFLLLFGYQLRIDQTADTDAYLLLPFFMLSLPVAAGIAAAWTRYRKLAYVLPVLLVIQVTVHFPLSQKKGFNISDSIMAELDRSAPPGSVLLISDWTMVSQYYYYRLAEGFRTDIALLNYDLKFTNWKILPALYPGLYDSIRPEYDRFIERLGAAHPQEIYNTGCTLDTRELMDAYLATVSAIRSYCRSRDVAFLCDPKAYLFLVQYEAMDSRAFMSGFLVSDRKVDSGKEFLSLPFGWLDSPLLLNEPAATDKMVDFEAALDFSRTYYRQTGDTVAAERAEASYQRIKQLQRRMKKNMPFVYRPGGS